MKQQRLISSGICRGEVKEKNKKKVNFWFGTVKIISSCAEYSCFEMRRTKARVKGIIKLVWSGKCSYTTHWSISETYEISKCIFKKSLFLNRLFYFTFHLQNKNHYFKQLWINRMWSITKRWHFFPVIFAVKLVWSTHCFLLITNISSKYIHFLLVDLMFSSDRRFFLCEKPCTILKVAIQL